MDRSKNYEWVRTEKGKAYFKRMMTEQRETGRFWEHSRTTLVAFRAL